ncbi:MAG: fumarylacetoacetate hydrolase family protein [Chitinophagaceae bacterium]|nr:fumarylacetoacetate hydrolase family protein [Chitinophagaceae bacterium]
MKIIAIGRNYAEHIQELQNEVPEEPIIFMKPETSVIKDNKPFYLPDFSQNIHHEIEIILRICKEGKNIEEKFAHKYFDSIGLGVDFTARDLQNKLKDKGLPWELSKAFDGSAPLSLFFSKESFSDIKNLNFSLSINEQVVQKGNTSMMLHSFEKIISFASRFITLKVGDIIFTGTPKGVGKVKAGDVCKGYIQEQLVLHFEIQ